MNLFITGNPGCGKSTLIRELIDAVKGKRIAGIMTPELRKDGERYGFKIIDLNSGEEETMASVDIKSKFKVSKYFVDVNAINKIIDKFMKSFEKADYVFIDEIGKMEFYSLRFKAVLNDVLNSNKIVIATIGKPLVNKLKNKGEIIYLERKRFEEVKSQILRKIRL